MSATTTLIEFLLNLLRDPDARAEFLADGGSFLDACEGSGYAAADVHDALVLLRDNQEADFSRDYHTGHNAVSIATPPPVHHGDHDDAEAAVEYLSTYITQNYVDDRDTIVDNSVNQQIDTGGGDFDQDIDIDSVVASGDGSVAAGGDIEDSTLVTGDDNQVGVGNVRGEGNVVGEGNSTVSGDGSTVAFGAGAATSTEIDDVEIGTGGAFAAGGDAAVDNSDESLENVGNDSSDNSLENVGNDNSDESLENVGNDNSDNSTDDDLTIDGSGNIGLSLSLAAL